MWDLQVHPVLLVQLAMLDSKVQRASLVLLEELVQQETLAPWVLQVLVVMLDSQVILAEKDVLVLPAQLASQGSRVLQDLQDSSAYQDHKDHKDSRVILEHKALLVVLVLLVLLVVMDLKDLKVKLEH